MGVSRSDECAERVLAIVRPRYLVKLAVAGAVGKILKKKNYTHKNIIKIMHNIEICMKEKNI